MDGLIYTKCGVVLQVHRVLSLGCLPQAQRKWIQAPTNSPPPFAQPH